jgi:hypothetical protein
LPYRPARRRIRDRLSPLGAGALVGNRPVGKKAGLGRRDPQASIRGGRPSGGCGRRRGPVTPEPAFETTFPRNNSGITRAGATGAASIAAPQVPVADPADGTEAPNTATRTQLGVSVRSRLRIRRL